MILPSVMPDELARSLISRICVLNGADAPDILMPDMASLFSAPSNSAHPPSWCDLLASANRVTPQAFHAGHTLLPFRRAVRPAADCVAFGWVRDKLESSAHGSCADRHNKQPLNLCPECTKEDMNFWGFSYWRRSHQLHGSVLCQKHQIGLHEAKPSSWLTLPHDALKSSTAIDATITKSAKHSPVIQRYAECSAGLAERTQPVSTAWMVHILKRRLQSHQAKAGHTTRRLTAIAADMIRGPWQRHFFPELDVIGGDLNSLDRTCSSVRLAYSTQFYALALAVLFENPDDAMNEVNSHAIDTFVKQSNAINTGTTGCRGGLPAAARAFFEGASISEATRLQGIEAQQLEALLRAAAAPFTKLIAPRA
jgi:hypothetical protein